MKQKKGTLKWFGSDSHHRLFTPLSPKEGHKDYQRTRAPFLCGQAERVGNIQSAEEKSPGSSYCALLASKAIYTKAGEEFFKRVCQDMIREDCFKLKEYV